MLDYGEAEASCYHLPNSTCSCGHNSSTTTLLVITSSNQSITFDDSNNWNSLKLPGTFNDPHDAFLVSLGGQHPCELHLKVDMQSRPKNVGTRVCKEINQYRFLCIQKTAADALPKVVITYNIQASVPSSPNDVTRLQSPTMKTGPTDVTQPGITSEGNFVAEPLREVIQLGSDDQQSVDLG